MAIVGLMIGRALLMVASLLSMALWVHKSIIGILRLLILLEMGSSRANGLRSVAQVQAHRWPLTRRCDESVKALIGCERNEPVNAAGAGQSLELVFAGVF
jgi:hypothetical protein